MVVALLYEMQLPCNCFTLSLSGSDSRRSNSWQDNNDATMEIKVVGVLGMGVPRLACLRPAAWLKCRPSAAHLHQ